MSTNKDHIQSGFSIGDRFVYFSKYAKNVYVTGVVNSIMLVNSVRGKNFEISVKVFMINGIYEHTEIFHYDLSEPSPLNVDQIGLIRK